jgi:hypothetical protein
MTMRPSDALLLGGLNLVTPPIAIPAGQLIGGSNYEPEVRGYSRMQGYERYDGQPRPSDASYWTLAFDAGSAAISAGDVITGLTSGATANVLFDAVIETGTYGGADAAGYLILGDVVGDWIENEAIQVSAVTKSFTDGVPAEFGATNQTDDLAWLRAAVDLRRSVITAVPGSWPVRGIVTLAGSLYAFRDNAGGTAGIMHKATPAGWVEQSLGYTMEFDTGTAEFVAGEVVTGTVSGASATIDRVVLASGTWGSTAAGYLSFASVMGTFDPTEPLTGSISGAAVAVTTAILNTLAPGGKYDFTIHNFYGSAATESMYCVNGVSRGFEFTQTGSVTVLYTGLEDDLDKPTRVSHYKNHLFLGYATGEIINSEIGTPTQFRSVGGALSFSFGAPIDDFPNEEAGALLIFGRTQIGYIVGNDSSDFVLEYISHDAGAVAWTVQVANQPIYLDTAGVRKVETTQAFGNWRAGTLTSLVEPLFENYEKANVLAVDSVRVRAKDQYRLFYGDKSGLTIYVGRDPVETIPFTLDHQAYCTCVGIVGDEQQDSVFFGTDDGYVMQMDKGRSFDGESIFAWIRMAFWHFGAPNYNKIYHKCRLGIVADPLTTLYVIGEYDGGAESQPTSVESALNIVGGGGYWNQAIWNQFYWSAQILGEAEADLDGFGRNVSLTFVSDEDFQRFHTISRVTVDWSIRGKKR